MFKGWIDTHTHLNMLKERTPAEAIKEASDLGIEKFINIGTDSEDHPIVLKLAKEFEAVYCTLGVHPHDAEDFQNAKPFMFENLDYKKVVAVGEIGLDFYYDNAPRKLQREVFEEQMSIAEQYKLPVQIHTRDAEDETVEVLKAYKDRVKGILHCFSGSRSLAEKALENGFNISISGIATFKSAQSLRDTIKEVVPMDRLHVETDAPFLAPMPNRGKENHSAFMLHTAQVVADLKGVSMDELGENTRRNTESLFYRLKS